MRSKNSAWSRSAPVARRTSSPGRGGTNTSGSNRVAMHQAGFRHLGREHPVLDQEHVAVEAGSFVPGANLRHDAVDSDRRPPSPGSHALERDHVVELEELLGRDRDPELERRRILGADHASDHRPRLVGEHGANMHGWRRPVNYNPARIEPR